MSQARINELMKGQEVLQKEMTAAAQVASDAQLAWTKIERQYLSTRDEIHRLHEEEKKRCNLVEGSIVANYPRQIQGMVDDFRFEEQEFSVLFTRGDNLYSLKCKKIDLEKFLKEKHKAVAAKMSDHGRAIACAAVERGLARWGRDGEGNSIFIVNG